MLKTRLILFTSLLILSLNAFLAPKSTATSLQKQKTPAEAKASKKESASEIATNIIEGKQFFNSATLTFRGPNMDFRFDDEGSNRDSVEYNSNNSLLVGASLETIYGAFSFAVPMYKAGSKDDSDLGEVKVHTDAYDLRYELALGSNTVWRAKYLKYKGFYKNQGLSSEVLRSDISASTLEVTGFYYTNPKSFPTDRQSNLTSGFQEAGGSYFAYSSIFENRIQGKTALLDSSFDSLLGKNRGFTEVNSRGASIGGGYGRNHLLKDKKLSALWALGVGGSFQNRTVVSPFGQQQEWKMGLSVVVEASLTYLMPNNWYTGLGANYITQSTQIDDLDVVVGNMDILMYAGKKF